MYKEQVDFFECNFYEVFTDRHNELRNIVQEFSMPNIAMNKMFKLLNSIFDANIHSIFFNSVENEFRFEKTPDSKDAQIFQDNDFVYYLILFDDVSNAVNVFSLSQNITATAQQFITKRYGDVDVTYSSLENDLPLSLSGVLVCVWLIDYINGHRIISRNLTIAQSDNLIQYFVRALNSNNNVAPY